MREGKILRDSAGDMGDTRVNECKVGSEELNGFSGANEPSCTREQVKNMQNNGGSDKTVLNGSVICSSEEQVPRVKFESVEKELCQTKEELGKVYSEKSQVRLYLILYIYIYMALFIRLIWVNMLELFDVGFSAWLVKYCALTCR